MPGPTGAPRFPLLTPHESWRERRGSGSCRHEGGGCLGMPMQGGMSGCMPGGMPAQDGGRDGRPTVSTTWSVAVRSTSSASCGQTDARVMDKGTKLARWRRMWQRRAAPLRAAAVMNTLTWLVRPLRGSPLTASSTSPGRRRPLCQAGWWGKSLLMRTRPSAEQSAPPHTEKPRPREPRCSGTDSHAPAREEHEHTVSTGAGGGTGTPHCTPTEAGGKGCLCGVSLGRGAALRTG